MWSVWEEKWRELSSHTPLDFYHTYRDIFARGPFAQVLLQPGPSLVPFHSYHQACSPTASPVFLLFANMSKNRSKSASAPRLRTMPAKYCAWSTSTLVRVLCCFSALMAFFRSFITFLVACFPYVLIGLRRSVVKGKKVMGKARDASLAYPVSSFSFPASLFHSFQPQSQELPRPRPPTPSSCTPTASTTTSRNATPGQASVLN